MPNHTSLQWLFTQNANGMTFWMNQKIQEYNYRKSQRPSEKDCSASGLNRRPNEKSEWKEGEEDELRGKILEFQTIEKAFGGAQEDLTSGGSSKKKDADVIADARMHIQHTPREVVKHETGNFIESSSPLVFCVSDDMPVKPSPLTGFVVNYLEFRQLKTL